MEIIGIALEAGEKAIEAAEKVAEKAAEIGVEATENAESLTAHALDSVTDSDSIVATDHLAVTDDEIDGLLNRAIGVERASRKEVSFTGVKICATRHGCSGATSCDRSYGAPVGR